MAVKMKFSAVFLTIIVQFNIASSCQDCCTRYVVIAKPSVDQASMCNCDLTINELLSYYSMDETNIFANCSKTEFLFQSGTHIVNDTKHLNYRTLSFSSIGTVVIRGEPNVTIKCVDEFHFSFYDISSIMIKNIHLWKCQQVNKFETYGVYFQFWRTLIGTVEILNSKFTDSAIKFQSMSRDRTVITIKDTIIENCSKSQESLLTLVHELNPLKSIRSLRIYITLENLNVRDNNSSFLRLVTHKVINYYEYCCLIFIKFRGVNYFTHNNGSLFDIVVAQYSNCTVHFSRAKVYISNNIVKYDGLLGKSHSPISVSSCELIFKHTHMDISNNQGSTSGGLAAYNSKIIIADSTTIQFSNNNGQDGGAMYLASSTLVLNAITSSMQVKFTNNTAQRGGAIYVEDRPVLYGKITESTVKSMFDLQCDTTLIKFIFRNNSALLAGDQIYGGWVDWFKDEKGVISYNVNITEKILDFEDSSDTAIASHPIRVCLCIDGHPDCTVTNHTMNIYGYAANLELIAVGQRYTPVLAFVKTRTSWESEAYHESQLWPRIVSFQDTCMNITYKIYSSEENIILKSYDFGNMEEFKIGQMQHISNSTSTTQALVLFQQLYIQLISKPCPLGFVMHKSVRNCICQSRILSCGLNCDYDKSKFLRKEQQWVGVTHEHTITDHGYTGVIVHQRCPFDYCRTDTNSLSFRLEDQDELCAFNRSGILCGRCETNFSRVLGSSKCKMCSNNLIVLAIVPSWLLVGLMLVILLMLFDLTVSNGTINGLIFYANIIQAQRTTFFTPNNSNSLFSKFIAWLNLDQGFETCLYNGLDDYVVTWLDFFFPLYIWILAAVLIVSSHYSTRISKLSGNNAVQVLATLFLITYAKLLRLIIGVFSFTTIAYPDGYNKAVWLIDGNIKFLTGKHIPLSLATILFVLLSLPYTLILLTIQWLLKISHYRVMFWVHKLKPFFDAYTGPYKANHRYWTGFLLIIRIILLTSFSLNRSNNPTINLLIIIVFTLSLLIWLYFTGWVYESWFNNCLEVFFLYNLSFTSAATLFAFSNNSRSPAVTYTSTGLTFAIFVGIILYHGQRQLFQTRAGAGLKKRIVATFSKKNSGNKQEDPCLHATRPIITDEPSSKVSCTVVELTEPLLEDSQANEGEEINEEL